MVKLIVDLSPEQQEIIEPLIMLMKEGEALIAQVYSDGMRLNVLDVDTSERVRVAIGAAPAGIGRRYAFELPENTVTPNEKVNSAGGDLSASPVEPKA